MPVRMLLTAQFPLSLRRAARWLPLALALAVAGCAPVGTRQAAPQVDAATEAARAAVREARELARLRAGLQGALRRGNEAEIERRLAALDNATLQREAAALPVGDPLYDFAGRALLLRGLPLPRPFDRAWNFDDRPPADRDGYRPPLRMAVLLPLSGDLSVAARPVRDGLLAGYYGEHRRRPEIRFYDTQGSPAGALSAYDRAVGDGNDFVVGPLGRDEVGALFARERLPVTTLALNRPAGDVPAGQASFSLSPEDEGLAAADYLLAQGAKSVLVIAGDDDTQRRAVDAFRERLTMRGGSVVAVAGEGTSDFSAWAGQPVNAVFIASRGSVARTLLPRLRLAGIGTTRLVATSQLLSGTGKAAEDVALDGVAFPTETWLTRSVRGLGAESVGSRLPSARGPAGRLFAFGHDAWLLAAWLDHLGRTADGAIEGATGVLRLDGFGNVQRTPAWSTFRNGDPVPLADAAR